MARDYKHRGRGRVRQTSRISLLKIIVFFTLPISLVFFWIYVLDSEPYQLNSGKNTETPVEKPPDGNKKPANDEKPPEVTPIKFDFYTILPKKEFVVPEFEIKTRSREERVGQGKLAQYILQAGSFKALKEAEPLRAKLATMGIESRIEKTKVGNVAWYRVNIGPYTRVNTTDTIRQRLKQRGIDVIVTETGR